MKMPKVQFKRLILFVGRKRQRVTAPTVFTMDQQVRAMYEGGPLVVIGQKYQVFIDGKLFSTTYPAPNGRKVVKLLKRKRGIVELHLVRKYTELASTKPN